MVLAKEEAKKEVLKLIEFYNTNKNVFEKQQESDIRLKLIDRLFKILGWDMDGSESPDEVHREKSITARESKKKKADYVFRLHGIPKFVVEAKAIKVDISNDEFREQAVGYAYNLACSWAILTNFTKILVYFVDRDDDTKFFNIDDISDTEKFEVNFDTLWYLSKESVTGELLEKDNEKRLGKRREKVGKRLFEDLSEWRRKLSNEIRRAYGEKYGELEREEIVQRIIDRLIFIRKIEDMELEERNLDQLSRKFNEGTTYKLLRKVFEHYRNKYNSGLFGEPGKKQECDTIDISDPVIESVIKGMYRPTGRTIEYNFAVIDADVLGNIYEQYLAFIMKGTKLKGGKAHKKEQGIYYTPTYIVDYIVKNTVTESARNKTIDEILEMKILDPACGSGSFLIRAYSELCKIIEEKMKKGERSAKYITLKSYSGRLTLPQKITILTSCIYGVDLDEKAVEIAQLNLLLKLLDGETSESLSSMGETRKLLPMLNNNIKCGNSLIDDPIVAGVEKAFDWKVKFKKIMDGDGFDVVIGNPPYVFGGNYGILNIEKEFFKKTYYSGKRKLNLFSLFIEKAINLTRNPEGKIGIIVPNTLLRVTSYEEIRKLILEKTKIVQIVNLEAGVFENVTASTIIIILQKENNLENNKNNKIKIFDGIKLDYFEKKQKNFDYNLHIFDLELGGHNKKIVDKINKDSIKLGDITKEMIFGVVITKNKEEVIGNRQINDCYKKFLEGKDIERYRIKFANKYLLYEKSKLHRSRTPQIFEVAEKLLIQRISGGKKPLKAAYDNEKYYDKESINNIILSDENYSAKYILAILNSDLINWYYSSKFTNASTLTVNVSKAYLSLLPIKVISLSQQQPLIKLVDKMLSLNKRLNELVDKKTDARTRLEEEIKRTDAEIDEFVYKIYGITEEEKMIIEESLK